MSNVNTKAEQFRAMHVRGQPLVLFNIWDAGSARAVEGAGARALATGSWAVATAQGYNDGEGLSLDLAIANLARIVRVTQLPVTIDLESGYGDAPESVGRAVEQSIAAGAIGCNLEDSQPAGRALRAIPEQVERFKQARKAADRAQAPAYFINARTDVFMNAPGPTHNDAMLAQVLERAKAYADAGANGLFAPGLVDAALIGRLAERSPLPLNVMVADGTPPLRELASLGVARVSHGGRPYAFAMKALQDAARAYFSA
jgi:2-methylisocitrate lyase-like PEP mutase family enzyme